MLFISLISSTLITILWHFSYTLISAKFTTEGWIIQTVELARYTLWLITLSLFSEYTSGQKMALFPRVIIITTCSLCAYLLIMITLYGSSNLVINNAMIYTLLTLATLCVLFAENLYRHARNQKRARILAISIGVLFSYDIYIFSNLILIGNTSIELWQARGLASGGVVVFILLSGALSSYRFTLPGTRLAISKPLIFTTSSMAIAASFLLLMSTFAYFVRLYGGNWGAVFQALLLFLSILIVIVVFSSKSLRARLYVWINKNFFEHKYNYRSEWKHINQILSQPISEKKFLQIAMEASSSVYKNDSAIVFLEKHGRFKLAGNIGTELNLQDLTFDADSEFIRIMEEKNWIFFPTYSGSEGLDVYNTLIPEPLNKLETLFLILPLPSNGSLIGFVLLQDTSSDENVSHKALLITWEDLELLRMVSQTIANYVSNHLAIEQLVESRQFDVFNKLSTYIMHDLKNLVAQQALVVENAKKHGDNPEFILDAIKTIDSSVARMNRLIGKLQQKPTDHSIILKNKNVGEIIRHIIGECSDRKPAPQMEILSDTHEEIIAQIDEDAMMAILRHLIRNAQDATTDDGWVKVQVSISEDHKNLFVDIRDNGHGMDAEFIKNRLFQPFDSTKTGTGMGIGVHQSKHFIESMGGAIMVQSEERKGTTFRIDLPLVENKMGFT